MSIIKPLTVVNGKIIEHASNDVEFTSLRYRDATTNGVNNLFLGENVGLSNNGSNNTGIGQDSLSATNGSINLTGCGYRTLYQTTTADWCTAIGSEALYSNTTASDQVAIGYRALRNYNSTVGGNFACGTQSLLNLTSGGRNMGIGDRSLWSNVSGVNNVGVGYQANYYGTGSYGVYLGSRAGRDETTSNKLYIHNNESSEPIIYGDMANDRQLIFYSNMNVDKASVFNQRNGDYDFTIKKNTSGDAYIYDAGNDTHTFSGVTYEFTGNATFNNNVQITGDLQTDSTRTISSETVTSSTTMGNVELCICNSSTDITLTLQAIVDNRKIEVKNIGTGKVTLDGNGSDTIGGDATFDLFTDESLELVGNGSDWI